ncbi:MAG: hypothetical protein GKR94_28435 [Gammaproteobacteria bacterium]|nr:hypothetical protein [Gammaproteobacteria bacterium]
MDGTTDSGVPGGAQLVAFAEAAVAREPGAIESARDNLVEVLGPEAAVDAAGVISNFQRMVRIADATGIGLGEAMENASADYREALGIEAFSV